MDKRKNLESAFSLDSRFRPFILMPLSPLSVKVVLKLLTCLPDGVVLRPILVAILEYEPNVRLKLTRRLVCSVYHLSLYGIKIHRTLHHVEVIWHIVNDGINRLLERAYQASPEAWSADHTLDQTTTEVQLLLRSQGSGRYRGTTASATGAIRLAYYLLVGMFDLEDIVHDYTRFDARQSNALHASRLLDITVDELIVNQMLD